MGIKANCMFEEPTFYDIAELRRHRQERLAGAFRILNHFGFNDCVGGHITVRDPERRDHFWVNPIGISFGEMRVSDLQLVNGQGDILKGNLPVNQEALEVHLQIHQARPDVVSAIHVHSLHGKEWSELGKYVSPLTKDCCAFYQDHGLCNLLAGTNKDCDVVATALKQYKAVILRNQGFMTVGYSVDEAVSWFIAMDRACKAQLLAEAEGNENIMNERKAVNMHSQFGTAHEGWLNFQPLWYKLIEEEPDVLH
ncbi:class II aldolase/adducin family protein [Bacillus massiliigorillae]|uniref:class II aldolase/adducin family protein n=1 Tax=Bacillus massiliigorillae TaxID=1243664 RepID=UPI0003A3D13B|nr:class II aldolase/adducin family protein [Bacillus massiliigorillae]